MKKRNYACGVSVVLLILTAVVSLQAEGGQEEARAQVLDRVRPKLVYMEGNVLINGEVPQLGQTVEVGSRVQTASASLCEITFGARRIFRLTENTVAVIAIDADSKEIDLKFGSVGVVLEKLQTIGEGGSFAVRTPTVVGGVRGTVFYIRVEDPSNTYVCVCNGRVGFRDTAENRTRNVSATHHEAYRYTAVEDGVEVSPASLLYHGDSDMEELAGKVGVEIDWESLPE